MVNGIIGWSLDIVYIAKLMVAFRSLAKNITILSHIKMVQNTKIIRNLVMFKKLKSIVFTFTSMSRSLFLHLEFFVFLFRTPGTPHRIGPREEQQNDVPSESLR